LLWILIIIASEPAVGEALDILQKEHGIKWEDLWLQTKYICDVVIINIQLK